MQVRIFEAEDMATGLNKVRNELGPDALILSTRSVKSGKLGLLGKPSLEITAAIDTTEKTNSRATPASPSGKLTSNSSRQYPPTSHEKSAETSSPQKIKVRVDEPVNYIDYSAPQTETLPLNAHQNNHPFENNYKKEKIEPPRDTLQEEMSELKSLVRDLAQQVGSLSRLQRQAVAVPEELPDELSPLLQGVQDNILPLKSLENPVINLLMKLGVNLETSSTIADFAKENLSEEILENQEALTKYLQETIATLVQVQPLDFRPDDGLQQRVALVGPTGVGKTTTIAKMAAMHLSQKSPSIAMITIDTYRIAAVEQLKIYCEIMNLPLEVVLSPQELEDALITHQDKDLILIDTAGRSPKDNFCIEELSSFLQPRFDIEKHLVLSATNRETELVQTINKFEKLGIDQTIITKIDECHSLGVLLNIQIRNPNPISFLTNGQRVPEDILMADQQLISELIMSNSEG